MSMMLGGAKCPQALLTGLLLLLIPWLSPNPVLGSLPVERFEYTASYRGILTLGLPVDIAHTVLEISSAASLDEGVPVRQGSLKVSTERFPRMEAFYPFRFDYRSWFDPESWSTRMVSMRKKSSSQRHDLLWFDPDQGRVETYRAESGRAPDRRLPEEVALVADIAQPERYTLHHQVPLPKRGAIDRLGMLEFLRASPLAPGERLEIPVSNGKDLRAYRIRIEAREKGVFNGRALDLLRIRLTPWFEEGGSRGYSVLAWLSDDERRLPLRFRSSKFGGAIELRLTDWR